LQKKTFFLVFRITDDNRALHIIIRFPNNSKSTSLVEKLFIPFFGMLAKIIGKENRVLFLKAIDALA
jgi:hypothetical protein